MKRRDEIREAADARWRGVTGGAGKTWLRSAGLAALCGSRTMLGPALVVGEVPSLRRVRPFVLCLAAGELLVDKMPGIPDRTTVAPMAARAVTGALVALASRPRSSGWRGGILSVLLGAAAATAATVAAFHLRRLANRSLGNSSLVNLATGVAEDALAVSCGRRLLMTRSEQRTTSNDRKASKPS